MATHDIQVSFIIQADTPDDAWKVVSNMLGQQAAAFPDAVWSAWIQEKPSRNAGRPLSFIPCTPNPRVL